MAENKTKPTKISVAKFLNGIEDEKKRRDAKALGKHKTGKSCLYIKRLDDIDFDVLRTLVQEDWDAMNKMYPPV